MEEEFDIWNIEKKRLSSTAKPEHFFYHAREVWWCSIGLNVGVEANGKNASFERPVLVLHKFNKHMFWGIPLTSSEKRGIFYLPVRHEAGISYAALSQLRTWSSRRLLRKVGMMAEEDFARVLDTIKGFLETNRPRRTAGSRRPKP